MFLLYSFNYRAKAKISMLLRIFSSTEASPLTLPCSIWFLLEEFLIFTTIIILQYSYLFM